MQEVLIILLLFSLFFAMMVVIVLYMSFHGIGTSGTAASHEGTIVIMNFFADDPVFLNLTVDDKAVFKNYIPSGGSVVYDFTQQHTLSYVISQSIDISDPDTIYVSNTLYVDQNSAVFVAINADGTPYEQFSTRVSTVC